MGDSACVVVDWKTMGALQNGHGGVNDSMRQVDNELTQLPGDHLCDGPNRLRFVLPISNHVTMPLGSYNIMLLFLFKT